ncbi:MAG: hypothetical protein AAGC73_09615 [Verrucomicrobiota bacterium]
MVSLNFLQAEELIKLSGRKDRVLPVETRELVLDVMDGYLSPDEDGFIDSIEELETPFSIIEAEEEVEKVVEKVVKINYDDASVLKVIGNNFIEEVRGTMARGTAINLQLKGGRLVKPGYSFPVRIPEIKNKTFTVTIADITQEGVRLELGDEDQFFQYGKDEAEGTLRKN